MDTPVRSYALAVAPNGARRTKADHPALPVTAKELALTAASVAEAGAAMIHVHVRGDDQRHLLDAERYRAAIAAIRAEVADRMVIQITTEAVGIYKPAAQMAVVREVRPEAASLAVRELCPDADHERDFAAFLQFMRRERIAAQYILYDTDDVRRMVDLARRGLVPESAPEVMYVLGRYTAGQQSRPEELLPMLGASEGRFGDFMICAFGRTEASCGTAAVLLGGGARIGFENNLHLPDGRVADDNAALVRAMSEPLAALGWQPVLAAELRERYAARFGE